MAFTPQLNQQVKSYKKYLTLIIFLIINIPIYTITLSFSGTHFNTSNSDFVNQHYGINSYVSLDKSNIYLKFGIEELSINSNGTIHNPINATFITERTSIGIPLLIGYTIQPARKFTLFGEIGYMVYIEDNVSSSKIINIENETSIIDSNIVSNYSETISNHLTTQIGLKMKINNQLQITAAKVWNSIVNSVSFTYLNSIESSKEIELSYDPLAISIQYYF